VLVLPGEATIFFIASYCVMLLCVAARGTCGDAGGGEIVTRLLHGDGFHS
jgi:hypothetical protein